jgi:Ser/Thr protein kinase RdoA (MazF antagonist)
VSALDAAPLAVPAGDEEAVVRALVTRLVGEWRAHFPEAAAAPEVARLAILRRPLSTLGRLELAWSDRRLRCYVKVHRKAGGDPDRIRAKAQLEFDTLLDLSERLRGVPGLAVPRPIAIFPEALAVVTEEVPGDRLHALLERGVVPWSPRRRLAALAEHCRAAGRWLRRVQDLTRQAERRPLPRAALLERIERDVILCARHGLRDGARLLDACRARLDDAGASALPVVGVHPDFQPDNVVIAPARVTVLDFTSYHHGPALSDPVRFLVSVDFLAKNPLVSRRRLDVLLAAFVDGYGRDRLAPRAVFELYILRSLVRSARSALGWPYPPPLRALLARRVIAYVADWPARLRAIAAVGDGRAPA